jgi:extracellular matrix regulatory protein B
MFLHVGADEVISLKRVIAIFDLRTTGLSEATKDFLSLARSEKRVHDVAAGKAKSLILCDNAIYLSPISSMTLKKRSDFLSSHVVTDLLA